ncbi:2,2-dialkylglycine decarboxylase [Microbacterium laevaniformans]|uniref:2,2-dialkylglycine decarboxylase n=1 Tax=Microbacterium laevaniformans TaxID=36807 RepID=A0A150HGN3_9MICO|nr:aminotransferase class III-fold pyridoxal phosphate-dependent enzyme [Microbacterium laevaniformans]KXZ61272.1 2,2-dialkylglycine decarboxylase [Microbacterium laevaniformans]
MTDNWLLARPEVDLDEVRALARREYGVDGELTELGSQQDRNFLVRGVDGAGMLVKIFHPTVDAFAVDLHIAASDRLRSEGLLTPEVLTTVDGARTTQIVCADGQVARVAGFQIVDGKPLSDITDADGAQAEELGELVAEVAEVLAGMDAEDTDRNLQWELGNALAVVEQLIDDLPEDRREQCLTAARRAAAELDVVAADLSRQVIHGDLTADNVMRDRRGRHWVIDLGDVATSWRAAELAMLLADLMGRTDDLAIVARAVAGFDRRARLTDAEIEALWPLVVLRGAVLAVSGWSQLRIDPGNDYARERVEHEWQVFARTARVPSAEVTAQLRLAAGRPHRAGLVYRPVLSQLDAAATVDLGIRSAHLDRGRWTVPGTEQALVRETLASAPVAVLRYGESRLSRVSTDTTRPAATRARCVELWTRPGVEVTAPFGGILTVDTDPGGGAGAVEVRDAGVVLRIEGLVVETAPEHSVHPGAPLGRVAELEPGLGRLRITRRLRGAAADAAFTDAEGEAETPGAADPSAILGTDRVADPVRATRHARRVREEAIGAAAERFYAEPPQIERGWGALLIDTQGRAYVDLVNNVTAIGHAHPVFADRIARQLHLLNTNSRFLYDAFAEFTARLVAHSPDPSLDTVIPVNSGSEAVDLALTLARVATGRRDVIAVRESYHGWTSAADAVSTSAFDNPHAADSRPDWVHLVDAPNAYRGRHRGPDAGAAYAREVADLARSLADEGRPAGAFICEPVLGNAGGVIPPAGYLTAVADAVRAHGGLVIADEVQVGYGRLGSSFWGSTMQGLVPDIVSVAKAAGNAYPLGAVITRREIVDALAREGTFFSSAGGTPASAVAGSAILDIIDAEGLQQNAARVGGIIAEEVRALMPRHPLIGAVHGTGLYLGIELVRDRETLEPAREEATRVCDLLLGHGFIVQAASERQNVLKVKPPLVLTEVDARRFVAALDAVLGALRD